MGSHSFFARRKLIISAGVGFIGLMAHFLSLKGFSAKKNKTDTFTTRYEIKIAHLPGVAGAGSFESDQLCLTKSLFPELDSAWFQAYEKVKSEFIESGSLLSSRRIVSADGTKLKYINTWKNRREFQRFCDMTAMLELHEKFVAANCDPSFKYS